ncbi:MAG: ABC transporter ATP-binding protein [Brachybacterium sp.]|nr:ABC transporter ATP-binding protein [Brachybacterium sp.]
MTAAVTVRGVTVVRDQVRMLDTVTAHVEAGEVLLLTGRNGAGKTTLLRVIAGIITPTRGAVRVGGRRPDDRDAVFRRTLAALIGPPQTARDLTLEEHLRFIAATWGANPTTAGARAEELLSTLAIAPLAHRYPHELSSGQSQLAAIAMTLARPSEVLLLDEPEQRLDPDRQGLVIDALRSRAEAGTALVLASHSPRFVEELADRDLHLVGEV